MKHRIARVIADTFRAIANWVRRKPLLSLILALAAIKLFPMTVFKILEIALSMVSLILMSVIVYLMLGALIQNRAPRMVKVVDPT